MQPNVPQREKYKRPYIVRNWQRLLDLSAGPDASSGAPTHIIWPEAAPPFLLARSPEALDEITLLTGAQRTLITGATRAERRGDDVDFYNSLYIFGPGGRLDALYDKFHLVPFGEYVPFSGLFRLIGITQLTESLSVLPAAMDRILILCPVRRP